MNPAPPPLVGFSLQGLVGLWILGTCLEVLVWATLFSLWLGDAWWRFTFGWMAIAQGLSTMLSASLAVLLFQFLGMFNLSSSHLVPASQVLAAAATIWTNPLGITLAYLPCPVLFETAWWKNSWLVRSHQVAFSKAGTKAELSLGTLFTVAWFANLLSWIVGVLFAIPIFEVWNDLWWAGGWLLCIPLLVAAAWSLTFSYRGKKAT